MSNRMTLADGQVAASAGEIYAGTGNDPTRINIVLQNTSASTTETVVVTMKRNAGTARRICRAVLAPNEQLVIKGLPVDSADQVLATTTNATTVDYMITGGGSADFSISVIDANGCDKNANALSSVAVTGGLTSNGPTGTGIGYATGAGGAVTQITNRSTGVTLSKLAGQITTDTTSLAAEAAAAFTVTNTTVAIGDVVVVSIQSGSNGGNTAVTVTTVAAGSFAIKVSNNNAAGGTAETGALIINYAVIKSVAA